MASISNIRPADTTTRVVVPAHVLEERRRRRDESIKRTNATIIGSAISEAQQGAVTQ